MVSFLLGAIGWAVVIVVFAWLGAMRGPTGDAGLEGATDPVGAAPVPADSRAALLRGQVLLERNPGVVGTELEGLGERPCRITVWREGVAVAESQTCDAEGHFEVAVPTAPLGPVSVTVEVPERLRGYIDPVAAPPSSAPGDPIVLPRLALGLGHVVAGQVLAGQGQPVPAARVWAMPVPNRGERVPWQTTADANGRFSFDSLPGGPIVLQAGAKGHAVSATQAIAPEDDAVIVLTALHDLEGEVVGPNALLERVQVRVEGSSLWPPVTASTPGGRFAFPALSDDVYGLEALVERAEPGEPEYASIPLENVSPDQFVTLALIPAFRIPVDLRDPAGRAIPGGRVTATYGFVGMLQRTATSDALGHAEVGPLVPGPYVLVADADGYLASSPVPVDLTAEPRVEAVRLVLARPGRIEGRVVDAEGRPVDGAELVVDSDTEVSTGDDVARRGTFRGLQEGRGSLGVTKGPVLPIPTGPDFGTRSWDRVEPRSASDGSFVVPGLAPGVYRLIARHGQHATSRRVSVRVRSGEVQDGVVLVLQTGHALTGRVRGGNDQPVARAEVELEDGEVVWTDERGVFDAGLHAGAETLVVRARGYVPRRVSVFVGQAAVDLELTLDPADGRLFGIVEDEAGRPIEHVHVLVGGHGSSAPTAIDWTDESGRFDFDALAPGAATVVLTHPDHPSASHAVTVGSAGVRPLRFTLGEGSGVRVLVREAGVGTPIAGGIVRAAGVEARTDRSGRAWLRGLPRSEVTVTVEVSGYVRETRITTASPKPDELLVELDAGGALEGEVSDDLGEPVAGARVVVRAREGASPLSRTVTDLRGRFAATGLPEGFVEVEAEPPASRADDLSPARVSTDILRARTTRGVHLRFDRR